MALCMFLSNYRHPVAQCDYLNNMQNIKCVYMEIWRKGGHSVTFNGVMMMIYFKEQYMQNQGSYTLIFWCIAV